jgi:hypothetical protein
VHAAFARYAERAEFCNPQRANLFNDLVAHLATPADQRTASWHAVDEARSADEAPRDRA